MGPHGRELSARLLMRGMLLLVLFAAPVAAQAPTRFEALLPELVQKIASAIVPGTQASLTIVAADADDAAALRTRIAAQLTARGIRVTGDASATSIEIGCGDNLRERVCVAEIRGDGRDQLATATQPLTAGDDAVRDASLTIELRPLVSQRTQILDAVVVRDRLLVLDVAVVTLYERSANDWRAAQSRPIALAHPWPRDPRGRIRVEGDRLDLFLPGATCTGRLEPLEVACADRQQAWPLGLENSGLEAGRNFFRTPDGLTFYNAASIGSDAAARWLVAGSNGMVQVLSAAGRAVAPAGAGDDVAVLRTACTTGTFAALASRGAGAADTLQLSRISGASLAAASSPVNLAGELTALWPSPDQTSATVVTHDVNPGRYDAFQASVSCTR